MDVKSAVRRAKEIVGDLFSEEDPQNIGLEEVEFDEKLDVWIVTIGFSRPWDKPQNALAALARSMAGRSLKVVRLSNLSENLLSVKSRS